MASSDDDDVESQERQEKVQERQNGQATFCIDI